MDGESVQVVQWALTVMASVLAFFASLFTATQLTRMGKIEEKANEALPRAEFSAYLARSEERFEQLRREVKEGFENMRREQQAEYRELRKAILQRKKEDRCDD